jgi:HK97 family phage major capsid protein
MDRELELRERMSTVRAALEALHEDTGTRSLSVDEQEEWDEGVQYLREGERMLARYDRARSSAKSGYYDKGVNVRLSSDDPFETVARARTADPKTARRLLTDANMRAMEEHSDHLSTGDQKHFEQTIKRHSSDTSWASNVLARQSEVYQDAWAKAMGGRELQLTQEERTALQVGNNTSGGYLLPTHLDPTIILTNDGTSNVIRNLASVKTLTAPGATVYNGVTSAGMTASWDTELEEVSDDSPVFARVSIPIGKAQAFVQASFEALEDIANLAQDLTMLFADARDRLEGAAHAVGTGVNDSPTGIFTALDANTNVEVPLGTVGTIALADIHGLYRAVPVRWRGKGTWLMNPTYALAIKALGTAVSASFSGELPEGTTSRILGRPVVESDDAPAVASTTSAVENRLIYGDFSNYYIVDKPGSMSVEAIPHLFGTTNNRPIGARGFYAYWRTGADSVNDKAFRLLQDGTSA